MGDSACAHRARLKRDPQIAPVETPCTQHIKRGANRPHFGMIGGIAACPHSIGRLSNLLLTLHDNGANGHFRCFRRLLRKGKRALHGKGQRKSHNFT